MKKIYLVCLTMFAGLSRLPAIGQTSAVTGIRIANDTAEHGRNLNICEVVGLLRDRGNFVTLEEGPGADTSKRLLDISSDVISRDELLKSVNQAFSISSTLNGNIIHLYDPAVRNLGEDYALDAIVPDITFENVSAADAIHILSKTLHLKLSPLRTTMSANGKLFSLKLHKSTVRDALTEIFRLAGFQGWYTSVMWSQRDGKDRPMVIVVMM